MEFQARFRINGTFSPKPGVKPYEEYRIEKLVADDSKGAYREAKRRAKRLVVDYDDKPEVGEPTVTLLYIKSPEGDVPFNYDRAVFRSSMLQSLVDLLNL